MKWCRYSYRGETSFGLIEGDSVREVDGVPWGEHTVAPHFHFGEETHPELLVSARAGVSALLGLVVHSFFDGISIGSAFIIDRALGLLVFTAIVLHKAPEGFAIASVVLATRGSRRSALLAAAAVGGASILGGFSIFGMQTLVGPALAVSAGVTLYVAASDLVPEVNRDQGVGIALTVPRATTAGSHRIPRHAA